MRKQINWYKVVNKAHMVLLILAFILPIGFFVAIAWEVLK